VQETRLWDAAAGRTMSMRSKEEAHDYRYFPDPDLPPVVVDPGRIADIRATMPELPDARRRRFIEEYALSPYHAGQLTQSRALADYFEQTVQAGAAPQTACNWITGALASRLNEKGTDIAASPISPGRLATLAIEIDRGSIGGPIARTVFERMAESDRTAAEIIAAEGLTQVDDESQIAAMVADVLAANADAVAQYRGGKASTFGFLVGQVMKAARGKANPRRVNDLLKRALDA
jgi:aspartyl-tRNA(Asn)/glutamyl-tRNA(Gln) amidotransferase subunit B